MSRGVPPRLPSLLLRVALDPEIAEFVMGDLEEEFAERCVQMGRARATRWYWKQTLRSCAGGFRVHPGSTPNGSPKRWRGPTVPAKDVAHGLRSFSRRPGFTSLVILIRTIVFLAAIVGTAGYLPARRASRIGPGITLKSE